MSNENPDLPFAPDLDSLCRWLAGLPLNDRETRYSNLFAGIQALNEANLEPVFRFKALDALSPPIFQAAANLTSIVLGKPFPLAVGMRKLAKLAAQFHAELVRGYSSIAGEDTFGRDFDLDEQGKVIHSALRSFNQMALRMALLYEAPPSSLWLRLNELYLQSVRDDLSGWSDGCPELANPEPVSVEALYLRILVFRLAEPYRLTQVEIQKVFDLIQQHGTRASLAAQMFEGGRKADFSVDLESSAMPSSPSIQEAQKGRDGCRRYLFTEPLRRLIRDIGRPPLNKDAGFSESLSKYLQIHLGALLAVQPGKKSRVSVIITGYANLVREVPLVGAKIASAEGLSNYALQSPDEYVLPETRIESSKTSGTFRAASATAAAPAEGSAVFGKSTAGSNCRVSPAEAPGFYIIESPRQALSAMGLVGLFTDNRVVQFGRICPGHNEKTPHEYGFELLANDVVLARVALDAKPKKIHRCFFSAAGDGRYSLITPRLRLRGGEAMLVDSLGYGGSKGRYRVARLLMRGEEFCQYELVPEAADAPA